MEIVRNNIIPFKGYKAVNLFGILFVRDDAVIGSVDINHESIHTAQMKEMLYEWLVRLVQYRNAHTAYRNISFEREAYMNQGSMGYLQGRSRYAWVKYLKNKL